MLPIVTIDFETLPIGQRPDYPPKPVGVSIRHPDGGGGYLRWGHPTGNWGTEDSALQELAYWFDEAIAGRVELLFFNMKFDLSGACEGWGLQMPPWHAVHDAMYLAFLNDPHTKNLDLKSLAQNLLDWPPEERDAVNDWVIANIKELRKQYAPEKISVNKGKVAHLYRWFSRAPGDVVEPYANGDTARTYALFEHLYPKIVAAGMLPAYDRLRRITPILMENERVGMRVDLPALTADCFRYEQALYQVEAALRDYLDTPDLNFDADEDVATALVKVDAIVEDGWTLTKTGQYSMAKDNLKPHHFRDPQLASALGYRNRLVTCLNTFMEPWLEQARKNNGYITTNWNITRGEGGGTRTGRPSTNGHNFLNLSKSFEGRTDGYEHPAFLDVPPLPLVRRYILPDPGDKFVRFDFAGQELRVFAHFEQADLHDSYLRDANADPHAIVGAKMSELMGQQFERTKVKILNFQSLYGGGIPAIQSKLECSIAEAKEFQAFHNAALPGRKGLADVLKEVTDEGLPIVTWGGRQYHVEPASYSERFKRWMTWSYKLINYIVQGSAADLTIESILDWYEHPQRKGRFLVQVYDEICISVPESEVEEGMRVLKECMERPRLCVPMVAEGGAGDNWADAK